MKTERTKQIAWCFPTSEGADTFGFHDSGCFVIEYTQYNEAGQVNVWHDEQVGGFPRVTQELLDAFNEADGKPSAASKYYHPEWYEVKA